MSNLIYWNLNCRQHTFYDRLLWVALILLTAFSESEGSHWQLYPISENWYIWHKNIKCDEVSNMQGIVTVQEQLNKYQRSWREHGFYRNFLSQVSRQSPFEQVLICFCTHFQLNKLLSEASSWQILRTISESSYIVLESEWLLYLEN